MQLDIFSAPTPNPTSAQAAQTIGMAQVLSNAPRSFSTAVRTYVASLPPGTLCTGESIRIACYQAGITPHHHNAWGAAISGCVRAGLLEETGRFPRMTTIASHARRNPEYRRS